MKWKFIQKDNINIHHHNRFHSGKDLERYMNWPSWILRISLKYWERMMQWNILQCVSSNRNKPVSPIEKNCFCDIYRVNVSVLTWFWVPPVAFIFENTEKNLKCKIRWDFSITFWISIFGILIKWYTVCVSVWP